MSARNHYVLVVHGTWAAPAEGERPWFGRYEDPGNFCWELEERLRGTDLDGAVFRAMPKNQRYWSWTGENSHYARLKAADSLAQEIERIAAADPQALIHVVAHSHGGNVLLKTIEQLNSEQPDGSARLESRLGRLVFLGTPFYRRCWKRHIAWLETIVSSAAIALVLALLFGAVIYIAIAAMRLGVWAFGDLSVLDAVNPFNWNPTVLGGWAVALLIIELTMFAIMRSGLGVRRFNSNVYFNELIEYQGDPLSALVIHSGRLDEALLGLTIKPLLDTALNPVVSGIVENAMGRSRVDPKWLEPVTGDSAQFTHGFRSLRRSVIFLFKAVTNRAFAWILNPATRFLKRRLRTMVLSVVELAALGLPASEGNGSTIVVNELPELPKLLDLRSLDVSRDLVGWSFEDRKKGHGAEFGGQGQDVTDRSQSFEFLWDPEVLDEVAESSDAWKRVREDLERLMQEYPTDDPDRFRHNLQRSVLTLEQRIREVSGAISLEHSAYYEQPAVIDAIAAFLSGTRT